ncbi:MAG: extracellular solute-binding protein [Gallionellaceae bacterium]|nr:extracellular solute-binding protein [Gallionellaceae bacterium]
MTGRNWEGTMKRTTFLVLVALVAVAIGAWAAPKTMNLIWMATGPVKFIAGQDTGGYPHWDAKLCAEFEKANPGVKVEVIFRDITQGMLTFQTLVAAGTPPDVWIESAGSANGYLNDAYAIDFKQYLTKKELAEYRVDSISPYIRNGNYYALPQSQVAGGFAINLDMLKLVGEKYDFATWTTDNFLKILRKMKDKGIMGTAIMAQGGMSGWNIQWLYAFGAKLYNGKDYSKVAVNTPAAVKALNYMKQIVDEGLSNPYPLEQNEDYAVEMFTTGKLFSSAMQNGHTNYWLPTQVKDGKLAKEFELTFVEFPHGPGVAHVPTYGYQAIVVAHRSGNEARNKMVVKLARVAAGPDYVGANCMGNGGFSTIVGLEPKGGETLKASYAAIANVAKTGGLMDMNPFGARSGDVNSAWKEPIQAFFNGEITAQQALDQFEEAANDALSR